MLIPIASISIVSSGEQNTELFEANVENIGNLAF